MFNQTAAFVARTAGPASLALATATGRFAAQSIQAAAVAAGSMVVTGGIVLAAEKTHAAFKARRTNRHMTDLMTNKTLISQIITQHFDAMTPEAKIKLLDQLGLVQNTGEQPTPPAA